MRKGGQKAKGNTHQRAVAKLFTGAYYPYEDGEFRSTPGSGSWDKKAAPGDVIAFKYISKDTEEMVIDETFPMVVECKDWKDENVKHFVSGLYSEECHFFSWMHQAQGDATLVQKIPIVVFKLYRTENMAMLRHTSFHQLANLFGNFVGKIYVLERIMPIGFYEADTLGRASDKLVFVLLKDFLRWIDWSIYKLADKIRSIRSMIEREKK